MYSQAAAPLGGDGGGPRIQVCQALWDAHGMIPGQCSASRAHIPLQPGRLRAGSGTGTCPLGSGIAAVSASQLHSLHQGWCSLVLSQDARAAPACSVTSPLANRALCAHWHCPGLHNKNQGHIQPQWTRRICSDPAIWGQGSHSPVTGMSSRRAGSWGTSG